MIISYSCDPHYGLQILNLMNKKNQPNDQKYQSFFLTTSKNEIRCFKKFHIIYNMTKNL